MSEAINFIPASALPEAIGEAVDVICLENGEMKKKSGAALGGGGAKSWNDLDDRPFYAEEGAFPTYDGVLEGKETVQADTNMWFVKMSNYVPAMEDLVGKKVVVRNGEEDFERVIAAEELQDMSTYGFPAFIWSADGMPFIYVFTDDFSQSGISATKGFYFIHFIEEETPFFTKSLDMTVETIHKLDNKFLDVEWMASYTSKSVEIYPATEIDSNDMASASGLYNTSFIVGDSYDVYVNGEKTTVKYMIYNQDGQTATYLGNFSIGNSAQANTGEKFLIAWLNGTGTAFVWFTDDVTLPATLSINGTVKEPNKLPKEFVYDNTVYLNDHEVWLNLDYLSVAQEALANGQRVIGIYNGVPCEITSAYADRVDNISTHVEFVCGNTLYRQDKLSGSGYNELKTKASTKELYLASSTADSTKKFKITVDDSGTITATEVV